MKKPKYSAQKAKLAVEISSKIEGHKIPREKSLAASKSERKLKENV